MNQEDCLFCKIIRGEIPSNKVFENDLVLAFQDINPVAPHHYLLIPKKHVASLNDFKEEDKEIIVAIFMVAQKIAKEKGFDEKGYRLVANTNQDGGQTVAHFHFHLIAGRSMQWPPG